VSRLGLALSAFRRHIGRTIFTVLSVATAFAIFTILAAIEQGMNGNISLASAQRLRTDSRVSSPLPVRYGAVIRSIPGVVALTNLTGFAGYFRDPKQNVPVVAFSVPSVLKVYPEFVMPDDQKRAFLHDRQGVLVGDVLARKYGWRVGETIPVQGGPPQRNGSTTWTFHIDAIYHADLPLVYQEFFAINYDYLNEGLAPSPQKDTVVEFDTLVDKPKDVDRVARAIDARFTNSSPDTLTQSEQQFEMNAMRQFGDIGAILVYVGLAVFASMLLITGNTMVNSVRERMGEFAMMRALGFGRLQLAFIVLRESALLIGTGAAVGVLAGWGLSMLMAPIMAHILISFSVTWVTVALAATFALLFALATGLLPGRRVSGMSVAATLRRM
jgi:putative ABC transport system permease protein